MPRNPTQSTLPNISRLALVRTGTHRDQYTETADFFHAVLDQIKNVEDGNACEMARAWCAVNKGTRDACNSWKAWKDFAHALFTTNVPVPNGGTTWKAHFFTLCDMDPVDRLVLTGKERLSKLFAKVRETRRQKIEAAAVSGADSDADTEEQLNLKVLTDLFDDFPPLPQEFSVYYGDRPDDAWTTERDDKADVALALRRIYDDNECFKNDANDDFVNERTLNAIRELLPRTERRPREPPDLRMGEQLALLCSWVFSGRSHGTTMEPLQQHIDQLTGVLYTTIVHPLKGVQALADHSNRVTACLQALLHIARCYKEDGVDWSVHATPPGGSVGRLRHFACMALRHYLMRGDRHQKELICALISSSLHIPANEVASGTPPWERTLEFAKELAKTRVMHELSTLGINDHDHGLMRWSRAALSSIAGQLSAHAWRRSWN